MSHYLISFLCVHTVCLEQTQTIKLTIPNLKESLTVLIFAQQVGNNQNKPFL